MVLDIVQELFECDIVASVITYLQTYIIISDWPIHDIVFVQIVLILVPIVENELSPILGISRKHLYTKFAARQTGFIYLKY